MRKKGENWGKGKDKWGKRMLNKVTWSKVAKKGERQEEKELLGRRENINLSEKGD